MLLPWVPLLLSAVPLVPFQDDPPEVVAVPPAAELEPLYMQLHDGVVEERIGCLSILVAKGGEVVWEQGLGWAHPGERRPASSATVYPVASLSKSLVGLAAAILVDEGELAFDAPVAEVLKSFVVSTGAWVEDALTVRHLGQMAAGMPHGGIIWRAAPPEDAAGASLRAVASFAVVDEEPGHAYRYSNYTSGVLEAVVRDVSGRSLEVFLGERVFAPLGMRATRALPGEDHALVQVRSGGQGLPAAPFLTPTAGQGFYSCVQDLWRLAELHLDPESGTELGLSPAAIRTSRAPADGRTVGPGGYWMGWATIPAGERTLGLSNGQGFDATSCMLLCPEERAVVICLTNTQWAGRPGEERLADFVALRAMDAIVPGALDAFEAARSAFESSAESEESAPGLPSGTFTGKLVLEGNEHAAKLSVEAEGAARLAFAGVVATGRLTSEPRGISGALSPSGELAFFGETSELSSLSLSLHELADGRLVGSAILGMRAAGRVTTGSGGALIELKR